jgi:glutamate dehydrogenase
LKYSEFSELLIEFMQQKFTAANESEKAETLRKINIILATVFSIEEDRILRQFLSIVEAMIRTNFFRQAEKYADPSVAGEFYLAFKIDSSKIHILPSPRPMFEIYVNSYMFKGIHLRGGRIARGGIRWSERLDDFRVEILGLMKTQMIKNTVIVPVGSKGGFVIKNPAADTTEFARQGKECYKYFISGLLDLTDNYVSDRKDIEKRALDEFDPYLVVAADKGTASFSDMANEISVARGFWLKDAFASGGHTGYNHKDFGITAKGAWESIKRNFYELGKNVYQDELTVISIGDMSGDVFGNGMLYTDKMKLLAAFNHQHIFIDPEPDPAQSYHERKRLFALAGGGWDKYNRQLISKGGGVFSRDEASISITPEMGRLLGTKEKKLNGQEIIRLLLKSQVDLLFNGGIGTYIKSADESNADIGDKTNDDLRVNAKEVRAKIIGEGGNLGISQRGRIEFSLKGGRVFTDALDNSGGVDMSDHEVNLKILLDALLARKIIRNQQERNRILQEMGSEVEELVVKNNFLQAMSVALDYKRSIMNPYPFLETLSFLDKARILHRNQENIPENNQLLEFWMGKHGLTRPVLTILLAYIKIYIYNILTADKELDEDIFFDLYRSYFPGKILKDFGKSIIYHKLKRNITLTVMTNNFVNILGTSALLEISDNAKDHTAIIKNWFLLNQTIEGVEFRREVFKLIGNLDFNDFDFILLKNAENIKKAIYYVQIMKIKLDQLSLQFILKLSKAILHGKSARPIFTHYLEEIPVLKKMSDNAKLLFYKSLMLKSVIRIIHLLMEMKTAKGKGRKQSASSLEKEVQTVGYAMIPLIYLLEEEMQISLLRFLIENFVIKNEWEKNFKERLILRLEKYENQMVTFFVQGGDFSEVSVRKWVAKWKKENPLLNNIKNEVAKREMDLLFLEYLVENSLGIIL